VTAASVASVASARAASLTVGSPVAETMRQAGARDHRLGADIVSMTARLAVEAWAMAVNGDDTALTAIATPDAAHWLMHPVRKPWRVAPGPIVTGIEIWDLEASADPPRLRVRFEFAGRRDFEEPGKAEGADDETLFVGLLDLTLQDAGRRSWQLSSGHVRTLDEFLGYVFTSRRESVEEYRQRTGSPASPAAAGQPRLFSIRASFAEHDVRFGSAVTVELWRESAPARDEAVRLVWPAIGQEVTRALGEGDWRPSLTWVEVVELLGQHPAGGPPAPG